MTEEMTMEEMDISREIKDVLDSERLLTARMVDSVLRATQMASLATPEMQEMFGKWLGLVGDQVLREVTEKSTEGSDECECDLPSLARSIGISEATLFSILASLQRSGKIRVQTLRFARGDGKNLEACSCLTR
jgi:hypothetical protein